MTIKKLLKWKAANPKNMHEMNKRWYQYYRNQVILYILIIVAIAAFVTWRIMATQEEPYEIVYDTYIGFIGQTDCGLGPENYVFFEAYSNNTTTTRRFLATLEICNGMQLHEGQAAIIMVERGRELIVSWSLFQ